MTYTIYIDVLFLLNLIVDYIIIASTAFISGRECKTPRTLVASALGALYSTLIFFPQLKALNIIIFKILISIVIVLIAFKVKSVVSAIKLWLIYYIINFIFGGGMYAFYRFTNLGSKMNYSNGEYYIDLPLWLVILLAIGFYFMIKLFSKILNGKAPESQIVKIRIETNNGAIETDALIDTGNTLYDPISLLPVMLAEKRILDPIIRCDNLEQFKKYNMRMIPFCDAVGNKSMIYAFKPEAVVNVVTNEQFCQTLVGIVDKTLSEDGSFCALLHSKAKLRG